MQFQQKIFIVVAQVQWNWDPAHTVLKLLGYGYFELILRIEYTKEGLGGEVRDSGDGLDILML